MLKMVEIELEETGSLVPAGTSQTVPLIITGVQLNIMNYLSEPEYECALKNPSP
jgi:hypothetical protein